MVRVTIPFGYTLSPEKLTKRELSGQSFSLSIFICWKVDKYIISAKRLANILYLLNYHYLLEHGER